MSLRLRDGPRGDLVNHQLNANVRSAEPAISDNDDDDDDDNDLSHLFAKDKLDSILNSVLEQQASPCAKDKASNEDEQEDTWTIPENVKSRDDDNNDNDESSSLMDESSIPWLPIPPTASEIRASAPRVLPNMSPQQDTAERPSPPPNPNLATTSPDPQDTTTTKKKKRNEPDDDDDDDDDDNVTLVDQNRPIDQVLVPSTDATNDTFLFVSSTPFLQPMHRQRRRPHHYRSRLQQHNSNNKKNISAYGGNGGSILDALLMAEDDCTTIKSHASDSKQKAFRRWWRASAAPTVVLAPFLSSTMTTTTQQQKQKLYAKSGLLVLVLLTILVMEWTALEEQPHRHHHHLRRVFKTAHAARDGMHEEGLDRPVHDAKLLESVQGDVPSDVALHHAKVPTKREGPVHHVVDQMRGDGVPTNAAAAALPNRLETIVSSVVENEILVVPFEIQSGFAGTYDKKHDNHDIPFLWYIPRSGAGMIKDICSQCMGLTLASEVGGGTVSRPDDGTKTLEVVNVGGFNYVNVDTTTVSGIHEAQSLGLASSGLAQLVISPRFLEAASLFDVTKGRAVALLRHPVERAISMYYHLQKQHRDPAVARLGSIEEYAKSAHVENNWMVRILSGNLQGEVGETELAVAKEVLRTKVVVGLLERKEESMQRFAYYFGWPARPLSEGSRSDCVSRILAGDFRTNESAKDKVKEGSEAWSLLLWQNKLDLKLFKYAEALFLQQGAELFADMPQA